MLSPTRALGQAVSRVLTGDRDTHPDPYLELLRLGVEHEDIEAEGLEVTLVVPGALVTGTVISPEARRKLFLDELDDYDLARAVRTAHGRIADDADEGKKRPPGRRHLHLRDVTVRDGRAVHTLPSWRGPLAAVSGWTLGRPAKD
ncbi:hypothetical protein [Kitasatospora griseola]|uniref:hypothetical protein n=1 Tax=Kitasatospora griseola TaxID=2064 RepID=UPI0016716A43|nr:hypothetical protein [Kitasatospora griseola]GGR01938.1 hypothetical protein GCM10010195_67110 [Kitasatospora griseola]